MSNPFSPLSDSAISAYSPQMSSEPKSPAPSNVQSQNNQTFDPFRLPSQNEIQSAYSNSRMLQRNTGSAFKKSSIVGEKKRNWMMKKLDEQYASPSRLNKRLYDIDTLLDERERVSTIAARAGTAKEIQDLYENLAVWGDEYDATEERAKYDKRVESAFDEYIPDYKNATGELKQVFDQAKVIRGLTRPLNRRERNEEVSKYMQRLNNTFGQTEALVEATPDIPIVSSIGEAGAYFANALAGTAKTIPELMQLSPEERKGYVSSLYGSYSRSFYGVVPFVGKFTGKKTAGFEDQGGSLFYDGVYVGEKEGVTKGQKIGTEQGGMVGGLAGNIALYTLMSPILEAGIIAGSIRGSKVLGGASARAFQAGQLNRARALSGANRITADGILTLAQARPLAFRMSMVNMAEETLQAMTARINGQEYTENDFWFGITLGGGLELAFNKIGMRKGFEQLRDPEVQKQAIREIEEHARDFYDATGSYQNTKAFGGFIGENRIAGTNISWRGVETEARLAYLKTPKGGNPPNFKESDIQANRFYRSIKDPETGLPKYEAVKGRRVKVIEDAKAFSYKDTDGRWFVVEERSGLALSDKDVRFDTRGAAIQNAQQRVKAMKADGGSIEALVRKHIDEHGASPRVKNGSTPRTGEARTMAQIRNMLSEIRDGIRLPRLPEKVDAGNPVQVQNSTKLTGEEQAFKVERPAGELRPDGKMKATELYEQKANDLITKAGGHVKKAQEKLKKFGVKMRPPTEMGKFYAEVDKAMPKDFRGDINDIRAELKQKTGAPDHVIDRLGMDGYPIKETIEIDKDGGVEVPDEWFSAQARAMESGVIQKPPSPEDFPEGFWGNVRKLGNEVRNGLRPTETYANVIDKHLLNYNGMFMRAYMYPIFDGAGAAGRRFLGWQSEHHKLLTDMEAKDINETYFWGLAQQPLPKDYEGDFTSMRDAVGHWLERINENSRLKNPNYEPLTLPESLDAKQSTLYSHWRKAMDEIHPELDKASKTATGKGVGFIERYLPIQTDQGDLLAAAIIDDLGETAKYIQRTTPDFSAMHTRKLSDLLINENAAELMDNYMRKATYYVEVAEVGKKVRAAVTDERFGALYGDGAQKHFTKWIDDVLRGNKTVSSPGWKSVNMLKANVSIAALSWRITSALKQPIAVANTTAALELAAGKPGVGMAHMQKAVIDRANPEVRKLHEEMSNHLIRRVPDIAFEALRKMAEGKRDPGVEAFLKKQGDVGMSVLKLLDYEAAMIGHIAAKNFAVDELHMDLDAAMKYADSVVRRTQGTTDFEHLPPAFKKDAGLLFLHFQTFVNANFNFIMDDLIAGGFIAKQATKGQVLEAFTILMLGVMTEKAISDEYYKLKSGRDPRFSGNFLSYKYFATMGTDMIPGLSAVGEGAPLGRTIGGLVTGAEEGVFNPRQAFRFSKSAASLYGVPGAAQMGDLFEFLTLRERK